MARAHFPLAGLLASLLLLAPAAPRAESVADFYKGKQVTLVLSAGVGGGFANYGNAFAPYFSNHLPGHPTIIVQERPGAGGLRAMTYLYTVAPRDGTTIGLVHSSVPFAPLYGVKGATFDPRKMSWIGSIDTASALCIAWHDSPIKTWQDMLTKEFIVGGTGAGSQMETMPTMLNRLFGTKIRIISGYQGGADVFLAMQRGEVMGRCSGGQIPSVNSTHPDWFPEGKVGVPIQVTLERNPLFPDTPAIIEFAKDERTKEMLRLMFAPQYMDRPILTPPDVPEDRIAALRQAFHETMIDPDFHAAAAKMHLTLDEVSGDAIAKIITDAFNLPPEIVKAANDAMNLTGSAPSN